jgi:hypothetical protein
MTEPENWTTAPVPNPDGQYVYSPKVLGQSSRIRRQISLYSSTPVGISIVQQGESTDPDISGPDFVIALDIYVKSSFSTDDPLGDLTHVPVEDLTHEDVGIFSFVISPVITQNRCLVTFKWSYTASGIDYVYWDYYEVIEPMPTYDAFSDNEKDIVRIVSEMFEDLYDSVEGGPHLKEEFQTHFGTETVARCMELACHRINSTSQPYTNYNVGAGVGDAFPMKFYSVLVMGTYLEVVRHLIRSYTEYSVIEGGPGVAYVDRSSYADKWRAVLNDEKDDYAKAVRSLKRSLLGLGGGSLIVSGGIFGQANYFRAGQYAMSARAGRFYPVSFVVAR